MYYLKDMCCLCLNSKWTHIVCIDEFFGDGTNYLKKITTLIPDLRFKNLEKCPQRFVCGLCCQQIDQMYRFRERCLTNPNIFVEYIHQLKFLDDVSCQLNVRLTDLQHLHCIKKEPTETIVCQNENVGDSFYNADLPIKQEDHEIIMVKNEFECCEMSEFDCMKLENSHQLDETSNLRHSPNHVEQCSSASYIEGGGVNRLQLSNVLVCAPGTVVVKNEFECGDISKLDCIKLEHCHQLDETSNLIQLPNHIRPRNSTSYINDDADNELPLSNVQVCVPALEQQQHGMENTIHANRLNISTKHRNEEVHEIQRSSTLPGRYRERSKKLSQSKHLNKHTGERPVHRCNECGKKFTRLSKLKIHERIHTGERPYECKACGKKFKHSHNLINHERIHSGVRPYECKACGKKFSQHPHLRRHEQIHSGERPYECKECGKKFSQSSDLKIHERIHSEERPYECQECGKTFTDPSNLKKHKRIHSEERPYECKACRKTFNKLGILKRHKRIHSGERPYECKACGKKFSQSSDMKIHERIHSDERPYECKACGKKFRHSNSLKRHERIHNEERPYE